MAFVFMCFAAETMPKLNGGQNSHMHFPSPVSVFSHPRALLTVPLPVFSYFSERGGP